MSHLATATERVMQAAAVAGIRATQDSRNVNPPCMLVTVDGTERSTKTQVTVELLGTLISPGAGNRDAVLKLDEMVGALTPALDEQGALWKRARVTDFTSPSSGESLLAYELAITVMTGV